MTASLKRLICRVLIGMVLFTQFAVAAYACPGSAAVQTESGGMVLAAPLDRGHATGVSTDSMSEAGTEHGFMDSMLPNLCFEHCQYGDQKADQPPAPTVSPALLTLLYVLPEPEGFTRTRVGSPASVPAAPADPPHAILHCCLRD
jgi:hypothetical protein